MANNQLLIINTKVLPPVFLKVLEVKKLLASGESPNVSNAAKTVGISRSAFYKYKDYIFEYDENREKTLNLNAVLSDKAGVFSSMASVLFEHGANIQTVNQSTPVDGSARVILTVRTDNVKVSMEELLEELRNLEGIISIKSE